MRPDELMARAAASGIDLITTFEQSVPNGEERRLQNYTGSIPKQTKVLRQPEWTAMDAAHACFHMPEHLYAAFAYRFAGDESQRKPLKKALMVRVSEIAKRDQWKRIRDCSSCDGSGLTYEILYDEDYDPRTRMTKRKARGKPGEWETRPVTCAVCRSFGTVTETLKHHDGEVFETHNRGVGQVIVIDQLVDLAIFEEWLTVHYVTGLLQLAKDRLWAGLVGIYQPDWDRKVAGQYRQVQGLIDEWCGGAYSMMHAELREDEHVA
jgi:hypothetical protein